MASMEGLLIHQPWLSSLCFNFYRFWKDEEPHTGTTCMVGLFVSPFCHSTFTEFTCRRAMSLASMEGLFFHQLWLSSWCFSYHRSRMEEETHPWYAWKDHPPPWGSWKDHPFVCLFSSVCVPEKPHPWPAWGGFAPPALVVHLGQGRL